MGLLDDLIGQLAGGSGARTDDTAARATSGPDMSTVLAALAPVVLAMLSNSVRPAQAGAAPSAGGGMADVLGRVLGGARGTSGAGGGLADLLEHFQRAGFGDQTRSWVGTGQNAQLPPGALEQVFGRGGLSEIARMANVSEDDASRGLSQLIPEMVDRVTPNGQLPEGASLVASVNDLARRLGVA